MDPRPAVELFDLCDQRGRPLGHTKARSLVHRDGDWHRSFHCWVVTPQPTGPPQILLQQRAPGKDTWAGLWDVSVGGHYTAGEGIEGGLREIQEELGLQVGADELVQVGWRREQVIYDNGLIDREVQDVFFLCRRLHLAELNPDPREVSAVALVTPGALRGLATGRISYYSSPGVDVTPVRSLEPRVHMLTPETLVPCSGNYLAKVARFARQLPYQPRPVRRRWW